MRSIMSKWGKHIAAIAVFLVLTVIYFSPAVFEGKVVRQGDTEKAIGMGNSQMDEYEKTAQPVDAHILKEKLHSTIKQNIAAE